MQMHLVVLASELLAGADKSLAPEDTAVRAYARQRSMRQHMPIPVRPRRHSVAESSEADGASLASLATSPVFIAGGMSRSTSVVSFTGSLRLNDPISGAFSGRAR